MRFKNHSNLTGAHAFLSASNYHWVNYDDQKLIDRYSTNQAAARGSRLHELGKRLIDERVPLPRSGQTLNRYVNDGIGFGMSTEVVLFYSRNCFGTADTISFREGVEGDLPTLRIHDLKTGVGKVSFMQLVIYAAIFCLEYQVDPRLINIELRIYQNDDVMVEIPSAEHVMEIMARIRHMDKLIESIREADE